MDISTFIKNFQDALDEEVDLKPSTLFKELDEWSSLAALSIIAMADEEYEVPLKGDDIRNANTIEDLFIIIKNKKSE